eukprot:403351446
MIDRWQDFSKYLHAVQCEYQVTDQSLFQKYYNTVKPFIGLPLSKGFTQDQRKLEKLPQNVLNNSVGYDSLDDALKAGHEAIIDSKQSKIVSKVVRDNKLVEQRKLLQSESRGDLQDNLILVFTDTVSRQRAHYKLPETIKFFKEQDHREFFRLHALEDRTLENGLLFMYGVTRENLSYEQAFPPYKDNYLPPFEKKLESIIEYLKNQGFITGYVSNICETNIFLQDDFFEQYVKNTPADHENIATACDPHLFDYIRGTQQFSGHFSIFRRCIYGKDSHNYVFDYAKEFLQAYKNDKKIIILTLMDMHEVIMDHIQEV